MRRGVAFILELPLAILSLLFFLVMRASMRILVSAHFARRPDVARSWRVVGRGVVDNRLALLATLTAVPRWNTHAVCATAGPLEAKSSIAIRCDTPRRSAASWAIVVNAYPSQRPIARLQAGDQETWAKLEVREGRYMLISRYYHVLADPELPVVEVDGAQAVEAVRVGRDVNEFYNGYLKHAAGTLALMLHFHVVTVLRAARWLPDGLVLRMMAPSGTPDTHYLYGVIERGQCLELRADRDLLDGHEVLFDLYGRDSIPFAWGELVEREHRTEPGPRTGFYIVRVLRRSEAGKEFDRRSLEVRVLSTRSPAPR